MTTYYVSGSGVDGGGVSGDSTHPWRTLNHAKSRISSGDTVKIRDGTYREVLSIGASLHHTTWEADTGHHPVIDGNYNEGEFSGGALYAGNLPSVTTPGKNYLPGDVNRNILSVSTNNVTIRGIRFQNVAGRAIGVASGADDCLIEDNDIYFCAGGAIIVGPTDAAVENVTISGNKMDLLSMKKYSPDTGAGQGGVQGALKLGNTINSSIEFNIVRRCFGEGINLGKGNENLTCSYNTVYDCAHVLIYNNRSDNTVIFGNICFHTGDTHVRGNDGTWSAGIIFGDEKAGSGFPKSEGGVVYNNVVVNCGKLFQIRNNYDPDPERGYDTTADRLYVGYNTFVAGPQTDRGIHIDKNEYTQPHRNSVFENNLVDYQRAPSGTLIFQTNGVQGFAFRGNLWSTQPAADARSSSDQIGNPRLSNPGAVLRAPTTNDVADHNFNPTNYLLTDGSGGSTLAIDHASNGSAFNGLTMPNVGGDYFGGTRPFGSAKDIGFHEFGATVGTIVANFTQNGSSGAITVAVGDTVTFADTTSGAPVSWDWDFDDGNTSDVQNPTHTYSQPGTYEVELRVANASGVTSRKTGAAITVTNSGGGGDATVLIDVKRQGAKTTTGTQNYTATALGTTPTKAALYFIQGGTSDGTAANGILLGVGAAVAGNQQWSQAMATQHNVGSTNIHRQHRTDSCLISIDADGEVTGKATHSAHVAGGHQINVTDAFPSGYLTTAVLFAGDGVEAKAGTTAMEVGASVPVTVTVGFPYDLLFLTTTGGDTNIVKQHGMFTFGIVLANGTQYRRVWSMDNDASPTWARVSPSNAAAGQVRGGDVLTQGSVKSSLVVSPPTSTGFTITPDKQVNTVVNWLALKLDDVSLYLSDILTPMATGAHPYSDPGFEPMFLMSLLTLVNDPDSDPSSDDPISGSFGFFVKGAAGEYSSVVSMKINVATTDDQSLGDDKLIIPAHDGGGPVIAASGITFDDNGFTPTYTSVDTAREIRLATLAIGTGAVAPTGPVANFQGLPRSGEAPLTVNFTDLSDSNGESIDSRSWEFGDGGTSTTQNPSHIYTAPGTYAVSLSVTNGNGTDVETKTAYITVTGTPTDVTAFYAPHDPMPVTNRSINALHNDSSDPATFLYHEHALDMDAIFTDATPGEPYGKQGKTGMFYASNREGAKGYDVYEPGVPRRFIAALDVDWMQMDQAHNRILVKSKAGVEFAIQLTAVTVGTAEESGERPTGSVIVQVSSGVHDGYESNDGSINLTSARIPVTGGGRWAILYFTGVGIDNGATISSAYLTLDIPDEDNDDPLGLTIYANDVDSASAPSTSANDISTRALTTAYTTWNGTNARMGLRNSPDFAAVIQEVVDRVGWASGNDIAIVIDGATDSNFIFWGREHGEASAPTLTINWTP